MRVAQSYRTAPARDAGVQWIPAPLSRSSGNYLLGPAVIGLSRVFLLQMDLRSTARPLLSALAEKLGGTTVLALREGSSMVVIEAHVPQSAVAVARVGIGWHAPPY